MFLRENLEEFCLAIALGCGYEGAAWSIVGVPKNGAAACVDDIGCWPIGVGGDIGDGAIASNMSTKLPSIILYTSPDTCSVSITSLVGSELV